MHTKINCVKTCQSPSINITNSYLTLAAHFDCKILYNLSVNLRIKMT